MYDNLGYLAQMARLFEHYLASHTLLLWAEQVARMPKSRLSKRLILALVLAARVTGGKG